MSAPLPVTATQPPRLLELVRQVAHTRFGQEGPGDRCAQWTRRLVLFHGLRPPRATRRPATSAATTFMPGCWHGP